MTKILVAGLILVIVSLDGSADSELAKNKLMSIAAQEAQIANIGANKYMMLYGVNNSIPIINRWNKIEHRPALTDDQIEQINVFESQKQLVLKQVAN